MRCQWFLGVNGRLGDGVQVVGDHAPPHPALHPILTMVTTTVQLMPPFQPTDPSFNAGPPVTSTPKPPLAFVRLARGSFVARFRQHNPANAALLGDPLIRWGRDLAIGYQ